jgi:hypothetical protein
MELVRGVADVGLFVLSGMTVVRGAGRLREIGLLVLLSLLGGWEILVVVRLGC